MCLEQQLKTCYPILSKLPKNKQTRTIIYREVLDKIWNYILYNEPISEDEYCKIENLSDISYYNIDEITFIHIFSDNLLTYMYNIWEEDVEVFGGSYFLIMNIEFILNYIDDETPDLHLYKNHILVKNEIKNQSNIIDEQKEIITFKLAKRWYKNCNNLF